MPISDFRHIQMRGDRTMIPVSQPRESSRESTFHQETLALRPHP
jgi:hypothetical protein